MQHVQVISCLCKTRHNDAYNIKWSTLEYYKAWSHTWSSFNHDFRLILNKRICITVSDKCWRSRSSPPQRDIQSPLATNLACLSSVVFCFIEAPREEPDHAVSFINTMNNTIFTHWWTDISFSSLQLFKSITLSVCFILLLFHFPPQHAIWHLVCIFAKK